MRNADYNILDMSSPLFIHSIAILKDYGQTFDKINDTTITNHIILHESYNKRHYHKLYKQNTITKYLEQATKVPSFKVFMRRDIYGEHLLLAHKSSKIETGFEWRGLCVVCCSCKIEQNVSFGYDTFVGKETVISKNTNIGDFNLFSGTNIIYTSTNIGKSNLFCKNANFGIVPEIEIYHSTIFE